MASNLKIAREHLGKTLAEVADAVGMEADALAAWEQGDRPPGTNSLLKLAAFYRLPADVLMLRDGDGLEGSSIFAASGSDDSLQIGETESIEAALSLFRTQLMAMKDSNMLPLDEDTIEFCLRSMRGQLEEDARAKMPFGTGPGPGTVAELHMMDRSGKPQ